MLKEMLSTEKIIQEEEPIVEDGGWSRMTNYGLLTHVYKIMFQILRNQLAIMKNREDSSFCTNSKEEFRVNGPALHVRTPPAPQCDYCGGRTLFLNADGHFVLANTGQGLNDLAYGINYRFYCERCKKITVLRRDRSFQHSTPTVKKEEIE